MGLIVVKGADGTMDTTFCLYYGPMCLVNGIFDTILCVERWAHVKYPIISRRAPVMFNIASIVFILCPIIEVISTALAGYLYLDTQEREMEASILRSTFRDSRDPYGSLGRGDG